MPEGIIHYGGVKFRITGTGSLDLEMIGLDDTITKTLQSLTMSPASGREPTKLMNFKSQRARLRGSTNVIDETFRINQIVIYVKPLYTEYPQ